MLYFGGQKPGAEDCDLTERRQVAISFWECLVSKYPLESKELRDIIVDAALVGYILHEWIDGEGFETEGNSVPLQDLLWLESSFRSLV